MKKFLLPILCGCAFSVAAAEATDIITATPEGTLYTNMYTTTAHTYLLYHSQPASTVTDGRRAEIVVNEEEGTIYIHNIMNEFTDGEYWIKGTLDSEGNAEFALPQPAYVRPGNGTSPDRLMSVTMVIPTIEYGAVTFVENTENPNLKMKWNGTTLEQILPNDVSEEYEKYNGLIALMLDNGEYTAYGESDITYTLFNDPISIPADVEVEESAYTNKYQTQWDDPMTTRVIIYREKDGDRIWVGGLNYLEPNQLVTAFEDKDGNLTLVSGQFMGYTDDFFTFFYGAEAGRDANKAPVYTWENEVVLTAEGDTYTASTDMIINIGNKKPTLGLGLNGVVLTSIDAQVLTPKAPEVDYPACEADELGDGMYMFCICFTQEPVSDDGQALDPSKLYYTIYVNGEPYTFSPDLAMGTLPGEMTEVPYDFSNMADIAAIPEDGYHVALGIVFEEVETIGVQAIYKNRDGETKTEIVTWPENSGLNSVKNVSDVVKTEFYGLDGKVLSRPEGMCIIRTTHADGSVNARKVLIVR